MTAPLSFVRPVDHYIHTEEDPTTGAAVHHVVVHSFSHLYDEEGTAHHFTARKDRWGVLVLDQELPDPEEWTESTFWLRHRAMEVLYDARNQRCQSHLWCHAFCRKSQPGGGPLAFCSSPDEIAAERARRRDEA
ncbi:hypothetical protein ACH40E_38340 [Streptomyces acidicola]|uniref:hypothetical protein n=1 Tax=Streptomyces acidicola TaxID=2596892 RepID=UPI0037B3ADE6